MTVLRDMFFEEAATRLVANGWVMLNATRYDPTFLEGLTPSGRAFTFTLDRNGLATIAVAGRTRQTTLSGATVEDGAASVSALLDRWNALPANQR